MSCNVLLQDCTRHINVRAQGTRVSGTHAREATNNHQNSQAIDQLGRHRRQPAPILHGEGIIVMDRLNRRRAKQSGSAEVRIKFALLSSQCKKEEKGKQKDNSDNLRIITKRTGQETKEKVGGGKPARDFFVQLLYCDTT
jgi:hypothetical protein